MKYLLKFWDKKQMIVSAEDGEKVMYAKEKKIDCVRINGGVYETKAISYIEPIKEDQKNLLPEKIHDPVKKETLDKMKKKLSEKFNWK